MFRKPKWSPYIVGVGIGVLSWITFGLMGKALGVSTTFVRWAGLLEAAVARDHVVENQYYAKYLVEKPAVDWQMMLVLFLPLGALVSTLLSRSYTSEVVPPIWQARFGTSVWKRLAGAFLGGFLILFGARMAGGCTSGHALSGSLQLSLSSWIFFAAFFLSAVVTAFLLYGKEARRHV